MSGGRGVTEILAISRIADVMPMWESARGTVDLESEGAAVEVRMHPFAIATGCFKGSAGHDRPRHAGERARASQGATR